MTLFEIVPRRDGKSKIKVKWVRKYKVLTVQKITYQTSIRTQGTHRLK